MKTLNFLITALMMVAALPTFATSWRVNNNDPTADYQDLQVAHDAASAGDTLYIEGSSLGYGNLVMNKPLVLIGPGYFLDENPNTPASLDATVGYIILNQTTSNDPNSGAAGSTIMGLRLWAGSGGSAKIRLYVSDVVIERNVMYGSVMFFENNILNTMIMRNFVDGGAISTASNTSVTNFTYANNIVDGSFRLPDNSSGTIEHNLFLDDFEAENFNGAVRSNILAPSGSITFLFTTSGNQVTHNTSNAGQFGNTNDNNTAAPTGLFAGGSSTDAQYVPVSAAIISNAHDGTHRGPFGGSLPYSLSGQGIIPVILFFGAPVQGSPGIPFPATVRAASGN